MEFASWAEHFKRTPLDYLRDLARQLLFDAHDYLLPVEFAATKAKMTRDACTAAALQNWLDDTLSNERASVSSKYGPIKDYERFGAPRDRDVADILDSRFPYLAWKK
jgi:hypothetical protein